MVGFVVIAYTDFGLIDFILTFALIDYALLSLSWKIFDIWFVLLNENVLYTGHYHIVDFVAMVLQRQSLGSFRVI